MSDNLLLQLAQAATEEQKACLLALAVLEKQPEATRRAALAAAVPHWFDAAVLAALLETPTPAPPLTQGRGESSSELPPLSEGRGRGGVAEIYATLQTLPFAQRYGESGHALHDLTRAGLIGYVLREQPDDFRAYSRRAARFFAAKDAIECVYHLLASDTDAGIGRFEKLIIELCEQRRDLSGAHRLVAYLRELLALRALTGAKAERALSFGYSYLGDLQMNYASVSAAAESHQQAHEIWQRLAQADPANAAAQRDLCASFYRLGAVQEALEQPEAARQWYQQALSIAARLAAQDPANAQAQSDLKKLQETIENLQGGQS